MEDEPLRVLIAEDETIIRMDLCGLLEKHGLVVCGEARDGEEAVALARELRPDVALLDLRMPGMTGIEAARRIYAERPIPIVMLTAYADRGAVEGAIAAGVFAYLVKPVRETDVVPALRAAAVRHAELLAARRTIGSSPPKPLDVGLRSPRGGLWPVRLERREDGSLGVALGGAGGGLPSA